jgi:3-oxoacyl-(acyl-carrier-protein) synthase
MSIFITGYGVVSAIGTNVNECFAALQDAKTGIRISQQPRLNGFMVGEILTSNEEFREINKTKTICSRTALLGLTAAKEAIHGHEMNLPIRTGFISGTSIGGMDVTNGEYQKFLHEKLYNKSIFMHHPCGTTSEQIAEQLGISYFINTISTACSSAANALIMGARMLETNQLDRVIVGGVDSLSIFTLSGFKSLMILDSEWCRPFDEARKGINIGEGAGYLVLESERSLAVTEKKPIAQFSGWNNSSDAFHQTASSPEGKGAVLAMNLALKRANLKPEMIDYINVHGTATPNNDSSESAAIKSVFGENIPPFSSTKSFTGHTLGASGGIEAVFSILAIQQGCIYPNLNYHQPITETRLIPQLNFETKAKINHVLSNSFGFGGNNTSLVFSKY